MDGHSYLDKIIPEQFHLPMPALQGGENSVQAFLRNFLKIGQEAGIPTDQGVLLQLPRTLVPRRLIKTALKYSEVTHPGKYAFALILLYYAWPSFYRWLSVDDAEHIYGTLANFLGSIHDEIIKPLPKEFSEDKQLALFLDSFALNPNDGTLGSYDVLKTKANDIRLTILQLREVGLP